VFSGEVERTYGLLRKEGFAAQMEHHSPASQYGQLSRRGSYDALDFVPIMQSIVREIADGRFADEWDAESRDGYARLAELKEQHAGPAVRALEEQIRSRLGPGANR
jgi:ketol-acid reductoisomerase